MEDKVYNKITAALLDAIDGAKTVTITFTAQEIHALSGELIKADFYNALDQLIGAYKKINETVQNDI